MSDAHLWAWQPPRNGVPSVYYLRRDEALWSCAPHVEAEYDDERREALAARGWTEHKIRVKERSNDDE